MAAKAKAKANAKAAGRRGSLRLGALGWLVVSFAGAVQAQQKLELDKALPLDGPALVQPSGLAWDGKRLLMVCAVHDDDIFVVEPQGDKAAFKEAIHIRRPKDAEGMKLAWRGIAAGPDGALYLASEQAARILRVEKDGDAEWVGPSLLEAGAEKGLFAGENSGIEGLAPVGKKKFLVAASREPRGLLDLDVSGKAPIITAWIADRTTLPLPTGRRRPDFADLTEDGDKTWALCANSDAIAQVKWTGADYAEGQYWTYSQVIEDPKYKYAGLRMGLARGLAMDAGSIFIAVDNKGVGRQADANDKRPLLLVFKRPAGI